MDVRKIFQGISTKLLVDFETSAGINHQGAKGAVRESALREFLSDSRLPAKFGLGTGEIVSSFDRVSKQSDLVVFDRLDSIPLLYSDAVQVFPIESVYGVIEVKSRLSKEELFKSLENIRSVKDLVIDGLTKYSHPTIVYSRPTPRPFGIVFAYSLSTNSLESLTENLKEWELQSPKKFWPNLIVVLGEGVIHHYGEGALNCITNQELEVAFAPLALHYKEDAFFHFYSALLSLCSGVELPLLDLHKYFSPSQRIGENVVSSHDGFTKDGSDQKYRFTSSFIEKVITFCSQSGPIRQSDLLEKQFGTVPLGLTEHQLASEIYLYNPENLPNGSLEEVMSAAKGEQTEGTLLSLHCILINGVSYAIAMCSLRPEDFEEYN
ncbi:DUF6602 domain-containing protein [Pseudomonas viridiflava]|uniref:DUF6602 domain-containing protein n=1 Tax=Pseudomonas viridiflava TaxID=33069 RepID=UPI000F0179B1|nr:DUF6602 domain-containing protein [Pseudomonas viridiflava]